ncbi:ABC transporter ATP-binding protein [Candidatus Stoquefichus massiliensis]|uniref:ABC transporter ATP-binding protein n=1 Tax=Candidatus Stoquefichus massiliensis TaxID=1470350 RepID=UPI00047FF0AE|nr:ABC transporter ATP-binding protein [Candidatus Stoquefichus massiliensis]
MKNIIEIHDLTKHYGDLVALNHFELTVREGEILGLLGPNGSGKSTCINTILSLLSFDQGSIQLFGKEMTPSAYDIKSQIGVVFQDVAVFEELNVYENIDYFCGLYIKDKQTRKQYIQDALTLTGLEEFTKFKPKALSGGLLRRLNIACGIAHKPKLIFLDEPTVAVDPQSRNHILEGIKKLNEDGATIVYTTHYMEEVEQLCDDIVIMDKGKVIAKGTKDELKNMISLGEKVTLVVEQDEKEFVEKLRKEEAIMSVHQEMDIIHIAYQGQDNHLGQLIDMLRSHQIQYTSLFSERPTLNDVFLELTGKELRD